ncbi:MAG: response regulator [Candidatus Cryptobacteroides sp.]
MKKLILLLSFAAAVFTACRTEKTEQYSGELRKQIDSIVYANKNIDSLEILLSGWEESDNVLGVMVSCRELGKCLRDASRFSDAIDTHKKGLAAAERLRDTVQIVQALNNIGTDYRRIGILDEASSFHYQALTYCDKYSDQTGRTALKNRVVSLNGIGNVYLTMGNSDEAEDIFRQALKGEQALKSPLGQAINYANIGSILESRGQVDSARTYYQKSLEFNTEAGSSLGISLCHAHFGRLAENAGDYDTAVDEYRQAYDIMDGESDVWHWLESCLSLARVEMARNNLRQASIYLDRAKSESEKISSLEPLAEAYRLEYLLNKKKGDCHMALECYIRSRDYADSVTNEKNLSHLQNVRVRYERERKQAEIDLLNSTWQAERKNRNALLGASLAALFLTVIAILFLTYAVILRNRNQKILKDLEKMRTNFFTNITHEFRTPLTVIQSAAQDIGRSTKDENILQDTKDILRHGKGLLSLINQILDIAKMTSSQGKMETPEWKHGDIVGFISMICESHKPFAASRGVDIWYGPKEDETEMDFIPDYMQKAVSNLLSNAIKFSAQGDDVLVTSKLTDNGETVQILVSDKGIGMTREQVSNIFKPFYQAPGDSRNIGTGIGLSLVKLSVEAMNGKIDVHSSPGQGSVFIIRMPVKYGGEVTGKLDMAEYNVSIDTGDNVTVVNEDIVNDENATRILIIEDTPEVARWQMKQLAPEYNFYFATNGQNGLEKAEELVPDLIITDIMMPEMDGFELCRRIRSSEVLSHIPVIMVTAKATHEDRMRGLEAGADAYLEKPFHADELAVRVAKLLEQRASLHAKWAADLKNGNPVEDTAIPESSREFVCRFTDIVNEAIVNGELDFTKIASDMCITRTQLNRKIKAITGYTTTEYVLQIRISKAKVLLEKSNMRVGDVAQSCGFEDVAYFSSVFKKTTGVTPTKWKNRSGD